MRSYFKIWLCGVALFTGAFAVGQSVSDSVSATANAATSSATDSSTSDSVRSAANEEVGSAPSNASGSGARRIFVQPTMKHGRSAIPKLSQQSGLNARQALSSGELSHTGSPAANGRNSGHATSTVQRKSGGGGGSAEVQGSFPDSTDGTAFPNPSDAGTASPLEWNPGINFGLPEFSDEKFLNPTFKVAARSLSGPRKPGATLHAKRGITLTNGPATSLTSKPPDSLKTQSLGGSRLHTTVDQEILSPQ